MGPTVFLLKLSSVKVITLLLKSLITRVAFEKILKGIEHAGNKRKKM